MPCTIALLDGRIHYGLTPQEIERLALPGLPKEKRPTEKIHKASVRDLGWILSTGKSGATTVAATSFLAAKIGVRVFATGGIGGVHRDGHITMDVSADLVEMSRSPVVVVCAGAKSILDIARTLEYLETLGVAVIGYGTDEFPAFFTRKSGSAVPLRLDTPLEIAKLAKNSIELNVGRGVLVAVPISPKDEADAAVVEEATMKALKEAEEQKVSGREITPFLLSRVSQLTAGASLKSNIALLEQNARVAAEIAREMGSLENALASSASGKCPFSGKVGPKDACPGHTKHIATTSKCPYTGKFSSQNVNSSSSSIASKCPFASKDRGMVTGEVRQWTYVKEGNNEPKVSYKREIIGPSSASSSSSLGRRQCPKTGAECCKCKSSSSSSSSSMTSLSSSFSHSPSMTSPSSSFSPSSSSLKPVIRAAKGSVFVFGAAAVDVLAKPGNQGSSQESQLVGLSIPGEITISAGGVGRNMAETLAKFGLVPTLVTVLGTGKGISQPSNQPDSFGTYLINDCKKKGIVLAATLAQNEPTAVYSALSYSDGKFRGGVAHMGIFEHLTPNIVARYENAMRQAQLIVVDANIPAATISHILAFARKNGIPTFAEPTSAAKAVALARIPNVQDITFMKPNLTELTAFVQATSTSSPDSTSPTDVDAMLKYLLETRGLNHVILTQGPNGVKLATRNGLSSNIVELPIEESTNVIDFNGAGDSLAAGFIFGRLSGLDNETALRLGIRAARITSESSLSVSPLLGPSLLYEFADRPSAL